MPGWTQDLKEAPTAAQWRGVHSNPSLNSVCAGCMHTCTRTHTHAEACTTACVQHAHMRVLGRDEGSRKTPRRMRGCVPLCPPLPNQASLSRRPPQGPGPRGSRGGTHCRLQECLGRLKVLIKLVGCNRYWLTPNTRDPMDTPARTSMTTGLDVHMLDWGPVGRLPGPCPSWLSGTILPHKTARGGALASDPVGHPALAWGPQLPGQPRPTSAGPQ